MSRWKQFRFKLEELGCRLLGWAIPWLSRGRCVRLANVLGGLAYRLDARGRAVALANLECAFGERFTPAQRARIAQDAYRNFARNMLDLFWAASPRNPYLPWVRTENFQPLIDRLKANPCGVVFMCLHQGHWEWASHGVGSLGFSNNTLAESFKNPRLDAIFIRARQISGHTIIPQENSIVRLLKVAKRNGTIGMLNDLSLPPNKAATIIDAFGMKMCVPVLHSIIAQRTGALLVPVITLPQPDGSLRIIAQSPVEFPPDASPQRIAQLCWDALEPNLHRRPDLYLWPYKHFRFKPKNATHRYPAYANVSSKFEKLLKALQADTPS